MRWIVLLHVSHSALGPNLSLGAKLTDREWTLTQQMYILNISSDIHCSYSSPRIFWKWFDSRSLCTTSTSSIGKQIKSLVCISSIVIPCKEQLKSFSALLKTIHHETPPPPPPAEWWWKSTLTTKDHQQSRKPHWGTFQRTWKKRVSKRDILPPIWDD